MAYIITSKGHLLFTNHLLDFGTKVLNPDLMLDNLKIISSYLDRIGINWGPAFGTLIGVVRDDDFQPWKPVFDIYILREDEERFKDVLWTLIDVGFELARYERRGRYYLKRNDEYIKVFVLTKVCSDVRHTGSSDFIHEKYIQNTIKWEFKGLQLNVPADVEEYLAFQYGDWISPKQTVKYSTNLLTRLWYWVKTWVQDHLPDSLYYKWILYHRKSDFEQFKLQCTNAGVPLPENVQLASMKPRKYRRVLTVGVYDLLHKGHIELYRRAKGLGDYLIVAVQDSNSVLHYKPTAKILSSTKDRMYMIQSIRYVDEVVSYTDVDKIVKEIPFDIFVTGPDQNHEGFQRAIQWCEENGKTHIVLGRTEGVSSSDLKLRIASKKS